MFNVKITNKYEYSVTRNKSRRVGYFLINLRHVTNPQLWGTSIGEDWE